MSGQSNRQSAPASRRHRGPTTGWLLTAGAVTGVLLSLAPLAQLLSGGRIPATDLTSDPADVTGAAWYVGAVSDLTLFVWAAAATSYVAAALGLRWRQRSLSLACAWFGGLSLVFTLDDRFQLHEVVIPDNFGVPEPVLTGMYAVVMLTLLVRFRSVLRRQPEASILLIGVLALACWLALDVMDATSVMLRLAQEGAKLFGAVTWAIFPAAILVRQVRDGGDRHPSANAA